uniref:Uncharacterized protein n=1 Tax=Trichobilharzia regenti TaxID=157069 RepID=A0AA85JHC3_TRIRE|nr:unnamed protein product [Trichobilharzia regenti]
MLFCVNVVDEEEELQREYVDHLQYQRKANSIMSLASRIAAATGRKSNAPDLEGLLGNPQVSQRLRAYIDKMEERKRKYEVKRRLERARKNSNRTTRGAE